MMNNKMKKKLIIFDSDHTVRRIIKNAKNSDGNIVKAGSERYEIGNDNFVITTEGRFWKRHYVTYYFRQNTVKPLPVPLFPDIKQLGISAEDLDKLFTPKFYKIIAGEDKNKKQDYILYAAIGSLLASVYVGWQIHQLPEKIIQALGNMLSGQGA